MEFIFFIIGAIVGVTTTMIFKRNNNTYGIIEVDHNSGLCKVRITSEEVGNRKNKKAVFKIDHNAVISSEQIQDFVDDHFA